MIGYIVTLVLIIAGYTGGIFCLKYIKRKRLFTIAFPFLIFATYLSCVIYIGFDAGIHDWNFTNALPTANVSPFMYCLATFIFLFPKKIRKYLYTLVALLSFGLLCAGCLTCVFNIMRQYKFHYQIAADSFAHGALAFYGAYLIKSEQAQLDLKTCLISAGIILGVADVMLILNLILHTSFFGLSLYGNHNIYNVVVCNSGFLSAGLYYIGLSIVLCAGAVFQRLLHGKSVKNKENGDGNS